MFLVINHVKLNNYLCIFLQLDETTERILVLGLESAGKTTLMSQITTGSLDVNNVKPTEGFNVTNLTHKTNTVNIWEGIILYSINCFICY